MSKNNVTNIKLNPKLIKNLERLLDLAKKGTITSVIAIIHGGECESVQVIQDISPLQAAGLVSVLHREVMDGVYKQISNPYYSPILE